MRAVTLHGPEDLRVEDVPEPELEDPGYAMVKVEATGVCGSDLHIFHGRVRVDPGSIIGHEYVGTVTEVGDSVTMVAPGDRVLGTYCTACGTCFHCRRSEYHKCDNGRAFGHGPDLGSLPGSQAELLAVPNANLVLRKIPEGLSDDVALFAGDVAGTAYHAVWGDVGRPIPPEPGSTVAVLGLGPVGLCAAQVAKAAGAARVIAVDSVEQRLDMARQFGAEAVHLTEEDPKAKIKELTEGRGADLTVDAVGHPDAFDMACRVTRKAGIVSVPGVYTSRAEVHLGVMWIRALTVRTGHANVIGHLDRVLAMLSAGVIDPAPLVTHRMKLEEAPEAFGIYDRRESLKIVLTP